MVGWHHRLNGHWFGWTPGVGDGQGGLASYGSWDRKSRTRLNECAELKLLRLVRGALSAPLLMSMSEAFSVPFYTLIKLCYTKAL